MTPNNKILYAPLQPQENGSPYERNFTEPERRGKTLLEQLLAIREAEENNNPSNFAKKQAIDAYEKQQRFVDESGNEIDPTDTAGKNIDTGPTTSKVFRKKRFQDYLNDAKKQENN